MNTLFDILRKDPKGNFHWIEAVNDIETAQMRLKQLSAASVEEFVIFRNIDLRVVASSSRERAARAPAPGFGTGVAKQEQAP
jgi:hypothetical protein